MLSELDRTVGLKSVATSVWVPRLNWIAEFSWILELSGVSATDRDRELDGTSDPVCASELSSVLEMGGEPELDQALEMAQVLKLVWAPELDAILELVCVLQGEGGSASS